MNDMVPVLGLWTWWVLAGVLLIAELAAPGVLFIWLALAAGAVGLAELLVDLPWQGEIALFAALSVLFLYLAKPWLKKRNDLASDQPNLNQRMRDYVGRSYVLAEPITGGRGRLRIDDTLWEILGPDAEAGARVTVVRVEGLRLVVEPVSAR